MINIQKIDSLEIWQEAATLLIKKLQNAGNEGKRSMLLLSGGSAISVYQILSEMIDQGNIRSDSMAVGQIDERYHPQNENDINAGQIDSSGLTEILQKKQIPFYKIPQTGTLREAAFNYDKLLKKLFNNYNYHIALLGIGKDGHTAGILRGYKEEWLKDRFACGYENRGEFKQRITITPRVFELLDYGLTTVSGIEKKDVLERILNKGTDDINNLPGILIHRIKEVDLFTDIQLP